MTENEIEAKFFVYRTTIHTKSRLLPVGCYEMLYPNAGDLKTENPTFQETSIPLAVTEYTLPGPSSLSLSYWNGNVYVWEPGGMVLVVPIEEFEDEYERLKTRLKEGRTHESIMGVNGVKLVARKVLEKDGSKSVWWSLVQDQSGFDVLDKFVERYRKGAEEH